MKLVTPHEAGKILGKWLTAERKAAFFAALLAGFAANFLLLVYGLMSQDGLCWSIRYFASDWEISLGRWGQILIDDMRAGYAVSYLSASLSVLYTACAAVFITAALSLETRLSAVLTGLLIGVCPNVLATLLYENLSDAHSLGLLFACIGGYYLLKREKKLLSSVLAVLFMTASLSIYQSFIGFSLGLLMMGTLLSLLFGGGSCREEQKVFFRGLLSGIIAFVCYALLTKLFQAVKDIGTSSYYGVSSLSPLTLIKSLPSSLLLAYKGFFRYFFRDQIIVNANWRRYLFFGIFFAAILLVAAAVIIRRRIWREPARLITLLLIAVLLPAGLNLIQLLVPDSELYIMTTMQMALMLPFGLAVCERSVSGSPFRLLDFVQSLGQWAAVLMTLPVIFTWYATDVLSLKVLKETNDQALYGAERVLDRIESTEGYEQDMPIAFAGWFFDNNYPRDDSYWAYSIGGLVVNNQTHPTYAPATESIRKIYLEDFGVRLNMADAVTYLALVRSEEFEEMGVYPAPDSVRVMDGVMVVKLLEEPYLP